MTERFFIELNNRRVDTPVARSETLNIINGMRYLKLGVRLYKDYFIILIFVPVHKDSKCMTWPM